MQLNCETDSAAKSIFGSLTNNQPVLPIKSISYTAGVGDVNENNFYYVSIKANTYYNSHDFSNNIFDLNPLNSMILSALTIILLIGLIVSVLYRIPGLVAFLLSTCAIIVTVAILIASGYVISFGIILGIVLGYLLIIYSYFQLLSALKKNYRESENIIISLKKTIKDCFLKIFDLCLIMLIIALSFVYFGTLELSPFGMSLFILTSLFFIIGIVL
jgi:SecD/SecF fusion protein